MAKINIKSEKITPFGGIYYANKAFYALSFDKVINGTLGVRSFVKNKEVLSSTLPQYAPNGQRRHDKSNIY